VLLGFLYVLTGLTELEALTATTPATTVARHNILVALGAINGHLEIIKVLTTTIMNNSQIRH
jgi:hypothetical protein